MVAPHYALLRTVSNKADPGLPHTLAISNVTQLQEMNLNRAGNYYLTNDIDASITSTWNGGAGFVPIGNTGIEFTGTFDGCGYTITGLTCNRPTNYFQSLFGDTKGTAKIANVTLANVNIIGGGMEGALVGRLLTTATDEPLVQNCHSSGIVTTNAGSAKNYCGGLIGYIYSNPAYLPKISYVYDCSSSCVVSSGTSTSCTDFGGLIGNCDGGYIYNCYATGQVSGFNNTIGVGGLIGHIQISSVILCFATGFVDGKDRVGGCIGWSGSSTDLIYRCYARGNVSIAAGGLTKAGGFIGANTQGTIRDCYSWGNVSCAAAGGLAGGFVAFVNNAAAVHERCYSIGSVSGLVSPGGFVESAASATYTQCFWDTEASGNPWSAAGVGHDTKWMKKKRNFKLAGYDLDNIWIMVGGRQIVLGRPRCSYPVQANHVCHRRLFMEA